MGGIYVANSFELFELQVAKIWSDNYVQSLHQQTSQERATTQQYDVFGDPDCAGCGYASPSIGPLTTRAVHDIGVKNGQAKAIEQGLEPTGWRNPFADRGAYGQGFDDVMKGPNGDPVIVEYKGGTGKLAPGQMQQQWVKSNIQKLVNVGDPMGFELQTALNEGRLSGVVYSTPIVSGVPQPTLAQFWFWY